MRANSRLSHKDRQHPGYLRTNRPYLIDRCIPLPGISDHDVVLVDSSVLPARKKPVRRKVYLWKRANKQDMEEDLTKFTENFTKDFSTSTPVNMLWNCFKQKCSESIDTFAPSKMTSTRFSQAWCNRDILASQEERRGPSRKHVLPRNSRTGIATRRSRKKPSKHVEEPMMTTPAIW